MAAARRGKKPARKPARSRASKPARAGSGRTRRPASARKPAAESAPARLPVLKTYKLFVGGRFPRTESGRTVEIRDARGRVLGHVCRASRKDLREAVRAAREAQRGWTERSAYNRGQILYRMAEMLEGKGEEFAGLIAATVPGGRTRARREVAAAADRLVSFAGWSDKFAQVMGCRNPVEGPYHNFTLPEASGVVGVCAPDEEPLLALISLLAPPLCVGNSVVALGSEAHPLATAVFGEVCATSDLPAGAVNLLTGTREELLPVMAAHRDVDGIHAATDSRKERTTLESGAAENLKRVKVRRLKGLDWYDAGECHSPYWIEPFTEMKTVWHPSAT